MTLRNLKRQDGSVMIFTVLLMTVLLGFTALVTDVGFLAVTRAQLQTAADAGALAGCGRLNNANPSITDAESDARTYAQRNPGTGTDTVATVVNSTAAARSVQVTTSRVVNSFFASALGIGSSTITSTATARVVAATGIPAGAPPFVIEAPEVPIVWQGGPQGDSYSQTYTMQKIPDGPGTFTYINAVFKNPTSYSDYLDLLAHGNPKETTLDSKLYYVAPATASEKAVDSFASRLTQPGNQNILEAKAGDPRLMLIPVIADLSQTAIDGANWSYSTKGLKIVGFIGFWLDDLVKGPLTVNANGRFYLDYRATGRYVRVPLPAGNATVAGNQFFGLGQIQLTQ